MPDLVNFLVEHKIKFLPVKLKIDKKTGKKTYLAGSEGCKL